MNKIETETELRKMKEVVKKIRGSEIEYHDGLEIHQRIRYINDYVLNCPAKKILEKYWNKECSKKLSKLTNKWGIYAHKYFKFKEIIGEKKFKEYILELTKGKTILKTNANYGVQTFHNYFIEFVNYNLTNEIIPDSNLKTAKKCSVCDKKIVINGFIEDEFDRYSFKCYGVDRDSRLFKLCSSCLSVMVYSYLLEETHKKEALSLLKRWFEITNIIPTTDYYKFNFFNLPKEKIKEYFVITCKINNYHFQNFKCKTWFDVLIESKILKEKLLKMGRGYMCKADDGHNCLSLSEKRIDDWLTSNKINHLKEAKYPIDKELNPKGLFRTDWKVKEYYIEFFGLAGNKDYDNKIEIKRSICKNQNLRLIELYEKDLMYLKQKLNILF